MATVTAARRPRERITAAGGCAFGRKPYAADPLLKANRAVWGDRDKTNAPEQAAGPEPLIPPAPNAPLIGSTFD